LTVLWSNDVGQLFARPLTTPPIDYPQWPDLLGCCLDLVRPASQHSKQPLVVKTDQRPRLAGRTGKSTAASAGFLICPVDLQPAESRQMLADGIVDLDGRRGMAAQKATDKRRQRVAVEADLSALRARQGELEQFLLAGPATDWSEAVAKARYLLILFAQTPAAEDLRRARLIADVFADFERLLAEPKCTPVAGDAGLAPASLIQRRIALAKGQQRGNREAKKPKREKPQVAATAQASLGLSPLKSTGAKDDQGKKT
jgi:hypothetical protein